MKDSRNFKVSSKEHGVGSKLKKKYTVRSKQYRACSELETDNETKLEERRQYNGYRDLKVYQLAYKLAIEIFQETKGFPTEEKYALIDQIRRSSRSIPANISEAWKKRRYSKMFVSKLIDCAGEAGETEVWLDFAKDARYLSISKHAYFAGRYDEINRMLFSMIETPEKFCISNKSSRK